MSLWSVTWYDAWGTISKLFDGLLSQTASCVAHSTLHFCFHYRQHNHSSFHPIPRDGASIQPEDMCPSWHVLVKDIGPNSICANLKTVHSFHQNTMQTSKLYIHSTKTQCATNNFARYLKNLTPFQCGMLDPTSIDSTNLHLQSDQDKSNIIAYIKLPIGYRIGYAQFVPCLHLNLNIFLASATILIARYVCELCFFHVEVFQNFTRIHLLREFEDPFWLTHKISTPYT